MTDTTESDLAPNAFTAWPTPRPPADDVIAALARVRADLPGIGKDQQMDDGKQKWKYRGIEDITAALGPLLGRHGVVFVPKLLTAEPHEFTVSSGNVWVEWRCMVEYTVYGPGGKDDSIQVGPVYALARDGSDKGIQKVMTSAYKQVLNQVFCIGDSNDDIDQSNPQRDSSGERELTETERAMADGWQSVQDFADHRKRLRDVVETMGAEEQAAFAEWIVDHGLTAKSKAQWEVKFVEATRRANPGATVTEDPIGGPIVADPHVEYHGGPLGAQDVEPDPAARTEAAQASLSAAQAVHEGAVPVSAALGLRDLTDAENEAAMTIDGKDARWDAALAAVKDMKPGEVSLALAAAGISNGGAASEQKRRLTKVLVLGLGAEPVPAGEDPF